MLLLSTSGSSFWLFLSTFLLHLYLGMLKGWLALICSVKTINPHWLLTSYLNCLPLAGPTLRTLRIRIWTLALWRIRTFSPSYSICTNVLIAFLVPFCLVISPTSRFQCDYTLLKKCFITPTPFIPCCPILSLAENLSPEMQLLISYVYILNKYLLLLFWHTTTDILYDMILFILFCFLKKWKSNI